MRHQANEFTQAQQTCEHLNDSGHDNRRKDVFYPVIEYEIDKHHGNGASGPRNHSRAASEDRGDKGHHYGGVQSGKWRKSCD